MDIAHASIWIGFVLFQFIQNGYAQSHGPICYNCASQINMTSCSVLQICDEHESCFIRTKPNTSDVFETGCTKKDHCPTNVLQVLGKRETDENRSQRATTCNECCDTDMCNNHCSGGSVHYNPCKINPCNNGTCVDLSQGTAVRFTCQCPMGYSGTLCEKKQVQSACFSNPCVYGTCVDHGTQYTCTCQPGYTGHNCDMSPHVDQCLLLNCQYGVCQQLSGTTHYCKCQPGYTGRLCDTKCSVDFADIVFLLDSSGSVGSHNFMKQKEFVANISQSLTIGPRNIQIGVVTFASAPNKMFNLNAYSDQQSIHNAIMSMPYYSGGTRTDLALKYVESNSFTTAAGDRPGAANFLVVITDGKSNQPTLTTAETIKIQQMNVKVYAIGIGSGVSKSELASIASDMNHVFLIPDFHFLSVLQRDLKITC